MVPVRLDVETLFNRINVSKRGFIYYSEFVQAAINKSDFFKIIDLRFDFTYYDTDGEGFITVEDLQEIRARKGLDSDAEELL